MKLIICSAFYKEQEKLINYFKAQKISSCKNKYACFQFQDKLNQVYFLTTGMGYKNQIKNINLYITQWDLNNDYLWILTGLAGAINPELSVGTVVVPTSISNEKDRHQLELKKYFCLNNYVLRKATNRQNFHKN